MKVIYFPGFGGSKNSETFKNILKNYPQAKFIIYDNINAKIAYEQILNQLQNLTENQIFIGQSLGGFWAEYFAVKFNQKLLLINPSFEPYKSLEKYNLSSNKLENFKKFIITETTKLKTTIILSRNDTTVNPIPVKEKYKNIGNFIFVEGDHKFTNSQVLNEEIIKLNL